MIIEGPEQVTSVVLEAMSKTDDPRFKEVMTSLVRHLHGWAQEVKLTEAEWEKGIGVVLELAARTNDTHNEVILASDAVGLSTLVCLMNNGADGSTETAAALLGPFWRMNQPVTENGGSIVRSETPGPALFVNALVRNAKKQPLAGVEVDVWHSSTVGFYENQDENQADMNLRGKFKTDAEGRFGFRSVVPGYYPVPIDGPVGRMLIAQKRHEYRPAHIHFLLYKEGYKTLITQVFVDNDKYIDSDVVFGVTQSLIGNYVPHEGPAPAPDVKGTWYSLDWTFVMEEGEARLPTPPIK